jgi:hypothetical protein
MPRFVVMGTAGERTLRCSASTGRDRDAETPNGVRGHGLGAPLHAAALDRLVADGFTHAGLWVLDGNRRALRFYLRHGWIDTGRTRIDRGPQDVELPERQLRRSLTS